MKVKILTALFTVFAVCMLLFSWDVYDEYISAEEVSSDEAVVLVAEDAGVVDTFLAEGIKDKFNLPLYRVTSNEFLDDIEQQLFLGDRNKVFMYGDFNKDVYDFLAEYEFTIMND